MAELLKCIECEKLVSPEAQKCPHCGVIEFKGVHCNLCGSEFYLVNAKK